MQNKYADLLFISTVMIFVVQVDGSRKWVKEATIEQLSPYDSVFKGRTGLSVVCFESINNTKVYYSTGNGSLYTRLAKGDESDGCE